MSSSSAAELPPPRDPGAPYRVCLVCLGNICRSPMAETVLRAELGAAGLGGAVVVDSAGTGDWHVGDGMDPGARAALAGRGYDGSGHRARQFDASWLGRRDLILAMDRRNLADLRRMASARDADRIRLFGDVGGLTAAGGDVPDPWGGNAEEFGRVLGLLAAAAPVIAGRLARLLEPGTGAGTGSGAQGGTGSGAQGGTGSGAQGGTGSGAQGGTGSGARAADDSEPAARPRGGAGADGRSAR